MKLDGNVVVAYAVRSIERSDIWGTRGYRKTCQSMEMNDMNRKNREVGKVENGEVGKVEK